MTPTDTTGTCEWLATEIAVSHLIERDDEIGRRIAAYHFMQGAFGQRRGLNSNALMHAARRQETIKLMPLDAFWFRPREAFLFRLREVFFECGKPGFGRQQAETPAFRI